MPCWSCPTNPFRLITRRARRLINIVNFFDVLRKIKINLVKRPNPSYEDKRALKNFISWCLRHYPVLSEQGGVQYLEFVNL